MHSFKIVVGLVFAIAAAAGLVWSEYQTRVHGKPRISRTLVIAFWAIIIMGGLSALQAINS